MEQTATVSFPGLGLDFEVNRIAFHLGSIPVYWYGILIAMGFMLAILYVSRRAKQFGIDDDRMIDVVMGGAIGGIIGARAYFVLLQWDYYGQNLDQIFNTRSGGMAIYGGIIGGILIGLLMCKLRKVKVLPALDLVAGGFLIGQGIGRWGNFINVEAFGGNTSLPWGMSSAKITAYLAAQEEQLEAIGMNIDPNMPVHPTFLYESLWCLLGFAFIAWYTKRRKFDGELILIYMMWYGAGRAVIEGLRTDSLMIPNTSLRASQVLAITMAVVAAALWLFKTSKVRKNGKHLFVDSQEGQLIVKGEFYQKKSAVQSPEEAGKTQENQLFAQNESEKIGSESKSEDFPGNTEEKLTEEAGELSQTEHFPESSEGESTGNIAQTEDFPGNKETKPTGNQEKSEKEQPMEENRESSEK